jgi:hypothetical protein
VRVFCLSPVAKYSYIRRPEEAEVRPEEVRAKAEGGEVDYVLDSFEGLAELAGGLVGGED